jgi:hypothetical protein
LFKPFRSFILAFFICSFLHLLASEVDYQVEIGLGVKIFDHFSIAVHKEFGEVPGNQLHAFIRSVNEFTVISEISIDGVSVFAVDLNLRHHGKLHTILLGNILVDLLIGSRLLFAELVAGESQNL